MKERRKIDGVSIEFVISRLIFIWLGRANPHFSPAFYCGGGSNHVLALRSFGLLDILSSMPAGPSVALAIKRQVRLVSMSVCAASL
jgi:hypothetical protein